MNIMLIIKCKLYLNLFTVMLNLTYILIYLHYIFSPQPNEQVNKYQSLRPANVTVAKLSFEPEKKL